MPAERASSRETVSPGGTSTLAVKNNFSAHESQYTLRNTHTDTPLTSHAAHIEMGHSRATTGYALHRCAPVDARRQAHSHQPVVIVDSGSATEKARATVTPEAGQGECHHFVAR